jgi:hypothetical protein
MYRRSHRKFWQAEHGSFTINEYENKRLQILEMSRGVSRKLLINFNHDETL